MRLPFSEQQQKDIETLLLERDDKGAIYRHLQNLAGEDAHIQGPFSDIAVKLLTSALNTPNPESALNSFSRFVEVTFNRRAMYQLLHEAPFLIDVVMLSFGSSSYLSDILIRTPHYFYDIIDAHVMSTPKTRARMSEELASSLGRHRSVSEKLGVIRRYKRRESLRIGLRDMLAVADLETTTLELSNLAEATLQHCYEIGHNDVMKPKYGTPRNEEATGRCKFTIIGMGKLGGYELNFSSDIDLMFVYSDEGQTDTGIANRDYFSQLCEFIMKAMGEVTADGYVFRVDIRLRPESSAGVIVRSIESYENYYEGWGDLWERQALIKARPVGGDMEFGDEFVRMIHPFVYQRYLDGVTLSEIKADIRSTKARIEQRLMNEKANLQKHVKLGPGAIRDVEFTVQCLQMIHGGKSKFLRSQNTLEALIALRTHELMSAEDTDALTTAYRFLRTVEHRIQIEADRQRYSIPEKKSEQMQLAGRMGYRDTEEIDALGAFWKDYRAHTQRVRYIFEKVTATSIQSGDKLDIPLLLSEDATQQVDAHLKAFGFENMREARRLLQRLANGGDGVQFSPGVRRAFFKLAPTLLNILRDTPNPDMALRYLTAFMDKVGARSSYYTLFAEKPSTLQALTGVCGTSLYLAELLVANPELFDLLTVPTLIERPKTFDEKQTEAQKIIADVPASKLLTTLHRYKNDEIWRIALRNILGNASLPTTTAELSDLAEAVLQAIYPQIASRLNRTHGIPLSRGGIPVTCAIIALGKFGGRELNFSSDLDIMYVYSAHGQTSKGISNADYFSLLGLELVKQLAGNQGMSIYELDLRLRPHGKGGAIAMPLADYQHYYENVAQVWERQALTRARAVAGDTEGVGTRFLELAHAFAYGKSLTPQDIAEIMHTRKRKELQATRKTTSRHRRRKMPTNVKSGYGGLVDIEFVVQTLQLVHGTQEISIRVQNTRLAIEKLHAIGVLTATQRDEMTAAYQFLRRVENALRIVHDRPLDALPTNRSASEQLAKRLGYTDTENQSTVDGFLADYGKWTEITRTLFNHILNETIEELKTK